MPQAARHVDQAELIACYQECFSTEAGKIVLAHLVAKFGFTTRGTNVPGDPYGTHVNEGHRGVMVHIGAMLAKVPGDATVQRHTEDDDDSL
jgi:hypothetical protein